RVLDMNLLATFLLAKSAFPHTQERGGGTIVNVEIRRRTPGMRQRGRLLRAEVRAHRPDTSTGRGRPGPPGYAPGCCLPGQRTPATGCGRPAIGTPSTLPR